MDSLLKVLVALDYLVLYLVLVFSRFFIISRISNFILVATTTTTTTANLNTKMLVLLDNALNFL